MGVPKLWDLIKDTAETRPLMHLAVVDGFEKNINGERGREGENPELRLVFFRLAKLLAQPILPLFVFDGGRRPAWKRNKEISRKPHWMVQGVKDMILAFGFEFVSWATRTVKCSGEAEAELAYLNQIGEIDAVLSDDVDNFLFGAKIVIRKYVTCVPPGEALNPALNSQGKDDGYHVRIFNADVLASDPDLRLTRAGFDRLEGSAVDGCGVDTAHALAKCGFGDSVLDAFASLTPVRFQAFLDTWREDLRTELHTFPNLDVVTAYASPVTSESTSNGCPAPDRWCREHSLARLATFCESKFERGTKTHIQKRFASLLWGGALIRIIRRAALDLDNGVRESGRRLVLFETSQPETPKTPGPKGTAVTGDSIVETPSKLIALTLAGIRGDREDIEHDNLLSSTDASPTMNHKLPRRTAKGLRVWVPASMLELVEPNLVATYKASQAQKGAKKKVRKKIWCAQQIL
ncbi:PIN domain-like protein [Cantharellus anzutake]|uniref:PIN domain-like protein n=1 Tax=Cantharellus anzutake TaxID=1750568 RepID=UPI0019038458|nr:PIN domain-like protein [Cantharellus anzutake]KAF8333118.1 PIN domain-like protein [Cantharellus anzutake]